MDAHPRAGGGIYVPEQKSKMFACLQQRFGPGNVTGSEYVSPSATSGAIVHGVRHEDVQALSLASESTGCYISADVLEHVPDFRAALREAYRILRPGGCFVFTIPFFSNAERTVVRASGHGDTLEHHLPAQYHINPFAAGGSLVYSDFGWDILDEVRHAGFSTVVVGVAWSSIYGYLGLPLQFFRAEKKAPES
ncbi:MAG: methyltransferase domain-containing protein [Planctomycetota bacterium]